MYPPRATDSGLTRFCLSDLCEYVSILDPMKPPDLDPDILRYYPESMSSYMCSFFL